MKILLYITAVLLSVSSIAQTPYEKQMQKALSLWGEGNETEAVQLFERIASVETEEWLPSFYAAQVLTYASFEIKDKEKITATLKKATCVFTLKKT